jgi:hypothetical protein
VPHEMSPPPYVVPYSLPDLSRASGLHGYFPSLPPAKLYRTAMNNKVNDPIVVKVERVDSVGPDDSSGLGVNDLRFGRLGQSQYSDARSARRQYVHVEPVMNGIGQIRRRSRRPR